VEGNWRRLHNEELHNMYASPNINRVITSRKLRWMGQVARIGEIRKAHKTSTGKTEGKRSRGRPTGRWEHEIRKDLTEIGWEGVEWMPLAQNTEMNFRVP
jgi:hypothetical protein